MYHVISGFGEEDTVAYCLSEAGAADPACGAGTGTRQEDYCDTEAGSVDPACGAGYGTRQEPTALEYWEAYCDTKAGSLNPECSPITIDPLERGSASSPSKILSLDPGVAAALGVGVVLIIGVVFVASK